MDGQKINYHLIDAILDLLYLLQDYGITMEQLLEEGAEKQLSAFMDMPNIQTAYEVVRFMDEMPGGFLIYCADDSEEIIYANRALLRIFQCDTLHEFLEWTGSSFAGLVHPEDLEEVEKSIWEQIATSQYDLDYVEYRIARKDGTIRWIEDYGHFIHTEGLGDIFYVFLTDATDKRERQMAEREKLVQEKKQKEQKIQQLTEEYDKERKLINQEYLRRLEVIEGLSVNYETILYVELDNDQALPYRFSSRTEPQFTQKFQPSSYEWFITDYINTWVHSEDRELFARVTDPKYIRENLVEQNTYYMNYRIVCDDVIKYIQLRIVNVGNPVHISQIVLGFRLVDDEIRQELEQKELLETALNNANLAITAKNTFLSNMSHDMRTPLNAVLGYADLAQRDIGDESRLTDYLDKIKASGIQLLDMINKVLEISWIETNDMKLTESECDLSHIMQDIHNILHDMAEKKNIHIILDMSELEHPNVLADEDKLKQAIMHLAGNAVEYSNSDSRVGLSVRELEQTSEEGTIYQFVIKDHGIGIAEESMERIFEPFEREKNTTFSGVYGTGLGLTIAKKLIELMGGSIDVDSVLGQGSTFTVTLPFRIQDQPLCNVLNAEDIVAQLRKQKILLVEDNEINLEIETEILKGQGFCIETAVNGKIAVEKIRDSEPGEYGLVLMDIQMPVMNGREAASAIRNLENTELSGIPIIALSSDAYESDKRMSLDSGMNAHLTKPVDVSLLMETIVKILQRYQVTYQR